VNVRLSKLALIAFILSLSGPLWLLGWALGIWDAVLYLPSQELPPLNWLGALVLRWVWRLSPLPVVLGIVAVRRTRRRPHELRGGSLARIAVVLSLLTILALLVLMYLAALHAFG
jgi:hypothetical protein